MPVAVFQLAPGLTVQTSNLYQTNSIVVAEAKATVVVDPCWFPDEISALRQMASETPVGRATHILFTHSDWDHVVGWADFGKAILVAHPEAARRNPAEVKREIDRYDAEMYTPRPRPFRYPPADAFTSPSVIDLGGDTALLFPAPGHTADGIFTVLPERRVLIAGDYLSALEFPFISHSLDAYRATLYRTRELCDRYNLYRLVPGHGPPAVSREEIDWRLSSDLEYLNRLEAGVKALLNDGLPEDRIVTALASMPFRGRPIEPHLGKSHADNIRFLLSQA